ncbi:MAG: sigma-70 family RNA polymerase sigma factor [Planctomycetota bacterium]
MLGDEVRTILDEVQDPVYRFCLLQLGSEDRAREATQETALRIIQKHRQFKGTSKVTSWAIGIALNVCRELRRRESTEIALSKENMDQTSPLDSQPDQNEEIDQLKQAMQQLTERQRDTLILRYFEEMSVSETAETLQMAEGTVKATTSQAIKLLRRIIGIRSESS